MDIKNIQLLPAPRPSHDRQKVSSSQPKTDMVSPTLNNKNEMKQNNDFKPRMQQSLSNQVQKVINDVRSGVKSYKTDDRQIVPRDQIYQGLSQTTQVSVRNIADDKRRLKLNNNIIIKNHNLAMSGMHRGNNQNTPSLYATLDGGAAPLVGQVAGQRFVIQKGRPEAAAAVSRSKGGNVSRTMQSVNQTSDAEEVELGRHTEHRSANVRQSNMSTSPVHQRERSGVPHMPELVRKDYTDSEAAPSNWSPDRSVEQMPQIRNNSSLAMYAMEMDNYATNSQNQVARRVPSTYGSEQKEGGSASDFKDDRNRKRAPTSIKQQSLSSKKESSKRPSQQIQSHQSLHMLGRTRLEEQTSQAKLPQKNIEFPEPNPTIPDQLQSVTATRQNMILKRNFFAKQDDGGSAGTHSPLRGQVGVRRQQQQQLTSKREPPLRSAHMLMVQNNGENPNSNMTKSSQNIISGSIMQQVDLTDRQQTNMQSARGDNKYAPPATSIKLYNQMADSSDSMVQSQPLLQKANLGTVGLTPKGSMRNFGTIDGKDAKSALLSVPFHPQVDQKAQLRRSALRKNQNDTILLAGQKSPIQSSMSHTNNSNKRISLARNMTQAELQALQSQGSSLNLQQATLGDKHYTAASIQDIYASPGLDAKQKRAGFYQRPPQMSGDSNDQNMNVGMPVKSMDRGATGLGSFVHSSHATSSQQSHQYWHPNQQQDDGAQLRSRLDQQARQVAFTSQGVMPGSVTFANTINLDRGDSHENVLQAEVVGPTQSIMSNLTIPNASQLLQKQPPRMQHHIPVSVHPTVGFNNQMRRLVSSSTHQMNQYINNQGPMSSGSGLMTNDQVGFMQMIGGNNTASRQVLTANTGGYELPFSSEDRLNNTASDKSIAQNMSYLDNSSAWPLQQTGMIRQGTVSSFEGETNYTGQRQSFIMSAGDNDSYHHMTLNQNQMHQGLNSMHVMKASPRWPTNVNPMHIDENIQLQDNMRMNDAVQSSLRGSRDQSPRDSSSSKRRMQAQPRSVPHDSILIHVYDANRGVNRDFTCLKSHLERYMKYFEPYLQDSSTFDDIDISVHCDVKIFEWLLSYVQYSEYLRLVLGAEEGPAALKKQEPGAPLTNFVAKHVKYKRGDRSKYAPPKLGFFAQKTFSNLRLLPPPEQPVLDLKNVISVLISSDFLKMQQLVNECISYVVNNLCDVVRLPIDMSCLSSNLVWLIAMKTPVRHLIHLYDKRDKLRSRLFHAKKAQLLKLRVHLLRYLSSWGMEGHEMPDELKKPERAQLSLGKFIWQDGIYEDLIKYQRTPFGVDIFYGRHESTPVDHYLRGALIELADSNELELGTEVNEIVTLCTNCRQLYLQPGNFEPLEGEELQIVGVKHQPPQLPQCPRGNQCTGFNGTLILPHTASKSFQFVDYVNYLMTKLPASHLFLLLAQGLMFVYLRCDACSLLYTQDAAHRNQCRRHRREPQFHSNSQNFGIYPCCYKVASKFHVTRQHEILSKTEGCQVSDHLPYGDLAKKATEVLERIKVWLDEETDKENIKIKQANQQGQEPLAPAVEQRLELLKERGIFGGRLFDDYASHLQKQLKAFKKKRGGASTPMAMTLTAFKKIRIDKKNNQDRKMHDDYDPQSKKESAGEEDEDDEEHDGVEVVGGGVPRGKKLISIKRKGVASDEEKKHDEDADEASDNDDNDDYDEEGEDDNSDVQEEDESADDEDDNLLAAERALTAVASANRSNAISDNESVGDDESDKEEQRSKSKKQRKSIRVAERGNRSGRGGRHKHSGSQNIDQMGTDSLVEKNWQKFNPNAKLFQNASDATKKTAISSSVPQGGAVNSARKTVATQNAQNMGVRSDFDFAGQMLNFRNAAYSKAYRYVQFFGKKRVNRYSMKADLMSVCGGDALSVDFNYGLPCHLASDQLNQKIDDFLNSSKSQTHVVDFTKHKDRSQMAEADEEQRKMAPCGFADTTLPASLSKSLQMPLVPSYVLNGPLLVKQPVDPQVIRMNQQSMMSGTAPSKQHGGDPTVNKYLAAHERQQNMAKRKQWTRDFVSNVHDTFWMNVLTDSLKEQRQPLKANGTERQAALEFPGLANAPPGKKSKQALKAEHKDNKDQAASALTKSLADTQNADKTTNKKK